MSFGATFRPHLAARVLLRLLAPVGLLSCTVVPARPPSDLAIRSTEEPIDCEDCGRPLQQTRHYRAGKYRLAVTSSPKTEESEAGGVTHKRDLETLRVEVTAPSGLRFTSTCVDEYSYTKSSASVLAENVVDGYSCTAGPANPTDYSLSLSAAGGDTYEGELLLEGKRYALHSLREYQGGAPGRVRGFAIRQGDSTLAAWRSRRGAGPELLWLGYEPAPTEAETAFFLTTLFFGPGNMPF